MLDEWQLLQINREVSVLDPNQWLNHYWIAVFLQKSTDKCTSDTSERTGLGEVTITGLCIVKEAVRFYGQPENIPVITKELK